MATAARVGVNTQYLSNLLGRGGSSDLYRPTFQENLAETLEVAQFAREQARENALASMALERELYPDLYNLRQGVFRDLLGELGKSTQLPSGMINRLMSDFYATTETPKLLSDARERVARDFSLGGRLPLDVQRDVARSSQVGAGRAGVTGRTAQDIVARDLGLSGMALRQARTDQALDVGTQWEQMDRQAQEQGIVRRLGQAGTIQNLLNSDFNKLMGIASVAQGIPAPEVGLGAGDLVGYSTAMSNAQLQADAQVKAAKEQAKAQRSSGIFGAFGSILGGILGGGK